MLKIHKVREQRVRRLSAGGYQQAAIKAMNGEIEPWCVLKDVLF
jgi:hypothetical protein